MRVRAIVGRYDRCLEYPQIGAEWEELRGRFMIEPETINTALERQAKIVSNLQKEVEHKAGMHLTRDDVEKLRSLSEALHYNTLVWRAMVEAANRTQPKSAREIEESKKIAERLRFRYD